MAPNSKAEELATAVAVQNSTISGIERRTNIIEKEIWGNGKPGLEPRLRAWMEAELDKVKRHGNANMEEGDQLLLDKFDHAEAERERQHAENKLAREADKKEWQTAVKELTSKVDKQTLVQASMLGAFALYKVLVDMGVIHYGAK